MTCPNCGSDEWKLASLVYREGLQSIETQTRGAGAGIGTGGIGVGVGKGNMTGVQQSALSIAAAPPKDPTESIVVKWVFSTGAVLGIGATLVEQNIFAGFLWFMVGVFAGLVLGGIAAALADKTEYRRSLAAWSQVRMCNRCGRFYSPPE